MPNGLIFQWGTIISNKPHSEITVGPYYFPINFTNKCTYINTSVINRISSKSKDQTLQPVKWDKEKFYLFQQNYDENQSFYEDTFWFAIGN